YYDWVTRYILLYGDRPDTWKPFFQQGTNWTFFGNNNASGVKEHRLHYPIKARYFRFIPVAWNPRGKIGLRVTLYGCESNHDVLSFDGDDLISYQFRRKTNRTLQDDISFNFKTLEKDGVLMHAEGSQGDYITLELQKAQMIFRISLGNSPLQTVDSHTISTLGSLLDDQHWHSVYIKRNLRDLNITLDGETHRLRLKGHFDQLDLDKEIFFAGILHEEKPITYKQNFRGCLENIVFNNVHIADLARRNKSSIRFVGRVRFRCVEMPYVPVTFSGINNYLMVPGVPANLKLMVSFKFRTWDTVGLLMFTNFAGSFGSLEMALSEGQINVTISQPHRKKLVFAAGYRLNDGFWHSVSLVARENSAVVVIDDDEGAQFKINYQFQLRSGDSFYFGGCPKPSAGSGCYSNQTAFHGCMQLITVDGQPVDFHRMQLGWLGRFSEVMFNVCAIADRAWTIIQHDRYYRTKVLGSNPDQPFLGEVHYWNASWGEVSSLANGSEYCEQRIEYSCYRSRLLNTPMGLPYSFWMGRNNERHFYWGGSNPGIQRCGCGIEKTCADPRYFCNCDADHAQWRYDKGLLTFRDHLPVTQVVVGDTNRSGSEAWFSLGPLRCYGDKNSWNTVTFMKPTSLIYPTFQPDQSMDITFFFKTTSLSGTFLENTASDFKIFIRIELNTTRELVFIYDIGNGHENVTVKSPFPLNDNEWHEVKAEMNVKLARLKVDRMPWVIRNFPLQTYLNTSYDRFLSVGSADYKMKPYIGCLRGVRMNGVTLDLEGKANESIGVRTNCTGHCEYPLMECQNGARCVERYSHYICDCNGTGYEGPFCTIDIGAYFEAGVWLRHNILSAGMVAAQEFAKVVTLPLFVSNLTREEISFSFRTTTAPAVLLYISSFSSDYIAFLLRPDGTLQLNYQLRSNSQNVFQLSKKNMTDGRPHRVNVTRDYRTLYYQPIFPHVHDDGLAGIIAFVVIFLFLLAIACLFLVYHYFHRYKGSYLTNEPKPIDTPSVPKSSTRKEQPLPQIEEEGARSE
ncbi:hypothetical protein GDO78_004522, partial [Eleutherodactylus coqui]